MPPRLAQLLASLLLVLLVGAPEAVASARLVAGTVAAAPEVRGSRVLVPLLLDAQAGRRAGLATPVVRVTVPADGLRGYDGPLTPGDLRLGDGVAAEGLVTPRDAAHAVRPRLPARLLRVRARARIASFAALDAAVAEARVALAEAAGRLDAPPAGGAATPVRPGVAVLRERLVLLAADLGRLAGALRRAEGRVARRALPARDPGGRHAAERHALVAALATAGAATQRGTDGLTEAVGAVDAVLAGIDPGAAAVPPAHGPALRAALERARAAVAGLAPPRIGPPARAL